MSGKPRLTPAQQAEVVQRYQAGEDHNSLAQRFDICIDSILRILILSGVPIRKKPGGYEKTSDAAELEIVKEYQSGEGATTVAKRHGVDKGTVYNILRRHGVGRRPRGALRTVILYTRKARFSPNDVPVAQLHAEGKTPVEIAGSLGLSEWAVRYSLRKQGLFEAEGSTWDGASTHNIKPPKRPAPQPDTRTLRQNAFDGSPEAMYWAGFLMADGNIHRAVNRPSYRLHVRLAEKDICHLQRLKDWLKAETTISVGDVADDRRFVGRRFAVLQVTSNKLCESLIALGVTPNKTNNALAHESCAHSTHFWRGMIDGDGCVYPADKPRIFLAGSEGITRQFTDFVQRVIPGSSPDTRFHLSWCGKEGCFVTTLGRRADACSLAEILYDNDEWALPRKKAHARGYFP